MLVDLSEVSFHLIFTIALCEKNNSLYITDDKNEARDEKIVL